MIGLHWIISLSLLGLGIILFFYLASRKKYRDASAAQNYEKIRNKVTIREPEKEHVEYESSGGGGMLGNLLGGFIVIVVGTSLVPEISKQVAGASAVGNVSGAAETMLGLTTVFFTFAVVATGLGMGYMALRKSGLV